jgi:hypothetical protein
VLSAVVQQLARVDRGPGHMTGVSVRSPGGMHTGMVPLRSQIPVAVIRESGGPKPAASGKWPSDGPGIQEPAFQG